MTRDVPVAYEDCVLVTKQGVTQGYPGPTKCCVVQKYFNAGSLPKRN
jgi:hypothetical protein